MYLPTQALEDQVASNGDYIVSSHRFMISEGCDHMVIACSPRDAVTMEPLNGKVHMHTYSEDCMFSTKYMHTSFSCRFIEQKLTFGNKT